MLYTLQWQDCSFLIKPNGHLTMIELRLSDHTVMYYSADECKYINVNVQVYCLDIPGGQWTVTIPFKKVHQSIHSWMDK